MSLPTVVLTEDMRNLAWKDGMSMDLWTLPQTLVWEVLTIHFQNRTMRVRTKWGKEVEVRNVSAEPFFDKYRIQSKPTRSGS